MRWIRICVAQVGDLVVEAAQSWEQVPDDRRRPPVPHHVQAAGPPACPRRVSLSLTPPELIDWRGASVSPAGGGRAATGPVAAGQQVAIERARDCPNRVQPPGPAEPLYELVQP